MDAVLYHVNSHKKINGTLFYGFEYFLLAKKYIPNLKYILLNTSDEDREWVISIFKEKYIFDHSYITDIINQTKFTDFIRLGVDHALILDVHTYDMIKDFTGKVKTIRVYANESHEYLNLKPNHTFYGWYDYQTFNKKTRIKLLAEAHRTFDSRGDKIFVTSLNADNDYIVATLGLDRSQVFVKNLNTHNSNMFESINKMIYWHSGNRDTNNRAIVEAYIHNIPLEIHFNGHYDDSIAERSEVINRGRANELFLDDTDIMFRDFIDDCTNTRTV